MALTLAQLKTKANTKLGEFWDALLIKQTAYHLKHGKYFQLLVTAPVVDGADTTFVVTHPNDELHLVDVDFAFNSPIPFQISVTEWVGGDVGFLAVVVVELLDGRKFTRSRSLTDTRVRKQDYDNTDPNNPIIVGGPYYVGAEPLVETTAWTEVISEQL